MDANLFAWDSFDFPKTHGVVYVLGVTFAGRFEPFYVGETSRSQYGRIADYVSGQATASADFKVGKVIDYFHNEGLAVKVKFKEASEQENERKAEEEKWRKEITETYRRELLNDFQPKDSVDKVHAWCKNFLKSIGFRA